MDKWPKSTIGEVAKRVTKGTTPTTVGGRFVDNGIAFVKVESINADGGFLESKFSFIDEETNDLLSRSALQEDDVLFTIAGTIGRVAQVPASVLPANTNQAVAIVRPNPLLVCPKFLYYLLRDRERVSAAQARVVQSVQANFSLKELSNIEIPLPPLENQLAIASVLDALDDKIDLNRRMNETLEQTARALFKDWFVDFGPTKAKMAGQAAYLEGDLWDLFPERLDEVGVPEGWHIGELQELVELNPTEKLVKNEPAPYLDMAALPTSGSIPEQPLLRNFTSGTRFRNSDTLFARITPCLENGKTAFVQTLPNGSVGWGSTEFIVLRAKPPVPAAYTYLLARNEAFREHAIQSMTGTSGRQRVRNEALSPYPSAIPDSSVWKAFTNIIEPLFRHLKANGEESRTLAQTRDLLLPKLMLGELRVYDAEELVQEVV